MRAQTLFAYMPPPVAALGEEARVHLRAARLWVMLARTGRSPRLVLGALLGGAAGSFSALMDRLVTSWPDPFTTFPPCASRVSPDEHVLLTLLACAEADAAPNFHEVLTDMLPAVERQRLWTAACRLMAERIGAG